MSRDTARAFTDLEVLPHMATHFRDAAFPLALVRKLGSLRFLAANLRGHGPALGMVGIKSGDLRQCNTLAARQL